jgi:hypothetical protein
MVPRRLQTFRLKTSFEGFFPLEQVGRHVAHDSEIFQRMFLTHPAVVLPERNVQAPVQAVFDAPMRSDGFSDGGRVVFEAGKVLGPRQKIIAPSCLVFGSSAFVALKVTYPDMQPSMHLADEPNPGAIWHNYFLPSPLMSSTMTVTGKDHKFEASDEKCQ